MLYRAVAHSLLKTGASLTDEAKSRCRGPGARSRKPRRSRPEIDKVGEAASVISVDSGCGGAALFDFQRNFAAGPPGAVLDGRDIGTVICPDARVKIFVIATPEIRAKRRYLELRGRGESVEEAEILADIRRRDERDSSRAAAR